MIDDLMFFPGPAEQAAIAERRDERLARFTAEVPSADGVVTVRMNGLLQLVGLDLDPAFATVENIPRIEAAILDTYRLARVSIPYLESENDRRQGGPGAGIASLLGIHPWGDPAEGSFFDLDAGQEAAFRTGVWWHWRQHGWTLEQLAAKSRLPAGFLVEIARGQSPMVYGGQEWKREVIRFLADAFGISPGELLVRGHTVLWPWRLCNAAARAYSLQVGEISKVEPRPEAIEELEELQRRYSTDDPGEALRRAADDGLLEIEMPEFRGYPLPPAEGFPDGLHPMDYGDSAYMVAALRFGMAAKGWSEARLAAESGVEPADLRAIFENRESKEDRQRLARNRMALLDTLGFDAIDWSILGSKLLEPLAADWFVAKFLEGWPHYTVPGPPRPLLTPAAVEEYTRGREGPVRRRLSERLTWAAFEDLWRSSGWDVRQVADRSGVDFWQLQRFVRGNERRVRELVEPLARLWGLSGREFLQRGYRILEPGFFDRLDAHYRYGDRSESPKRIERRPELAVAHRHFEELRRRYGSELLPGAAYRAFRQDPDRDELEVDVEELLAAEGDGDRPAF